MITNENGFAFINTVLRKEINGSPITVDRFNNMLNFSFEEAVSDRYSMFEEDQASTDFFRFLKKNESIALDLDGKFDLSSLSNNYFHATGASYNKEDGTYVEIDFVSENEWDIRRGSVLEQPNFDYPIVKISDDKLCFYPLKLGDNTNLVFNAGFGSQTDWYVNGAPANTSGLDSMADQWASSFSTTNRVDYYRNGFEGYSQLVGFDDSGAGNQFGGIKCLDAFLVNTILPDDYYLYFQYYIENGSSNTDLRVWVNNSQVLEISGLTNSTEVGTYGAVVTVGSKPTSPGFEIFGVSVSSDPNKKISFDKIYLGLPTYVSLDYIKQPATPYFDWYYDANDRIQYLQAFSTLGSYTLQTGEKYIDKDDGTEWTAGSTIGSKTGGDDADNKTVEMEIPDDEKRMVFYSMLSKLGIPIDKLDATQYSMQMESKEIMK
jgi:hypothetical protein